MNSLQDALTEALEHPIAEPRTRVRPHRKGKALSKAPNISERSESLLWTILGTIAGSLFAYTIYKHSR
jgi:hypothetical protein